MTDEDDYDTDEPDSMDCLSAAGVRALTIMRAHMVELASRPTLLMLLKSRRLEKNHMIKVIPMAQTKVDSVPPRIV